VTVKQKLLPIHTLHHHTVSVHPIPPIPYPPLTIPYTQVTQHLLNSQPTQILFIINAFNYTLTSVLTNLPAFCQIHT